MTNPLARLPRNRFPSLLGFDDFFDTLDRFWDMKPSTFPPYNVRKKDNMTYLDIAVAGYTEDDLSVSVKDGTLTISSEKVQETEDDTGDYVYKGVAQRSFSISFCLGDHTEVKDAKLKDGMLSVELETVIPEEKQTRVIDIKQG